MSLEQKNTSVDTMERLRGMVVFYSSPLPEGSTAQFRKSPSLPVNSHARETESVGVSMQLHQLCRTRGKERTRLGVGEEVKCLKQLLRFESFLMLYRMLYGNTFSAFHFETLFISQSIKTMCF